jgi:predicted glycoside hydrolase/deacetylase ChbG (UPF0249 family)
MNPNPLLAKLGFSDHDRLAIIHADDIGMCQASLQAFKDLWENESITSGAVMVPCPWFPAAVEMYRQNPRMDLGVHLVLTSEWDFYRWRPLTAAVTGSSLVDQEGFFPRSDAEIQAGADPEEAASELFAQVERAMAFGLDVTHIDTHMGAVGHPKFMHAYLQLANRFRLPPMIPRGDAAMFQSHGMDAELSTFLAVYTAQLEEQGIPLVDLVTGMPLDQPDGQMEVAKKMLRELPPGLTHFIIHPSIDTPELRAITPDWLSRVANYQVFMRKELQDFIKSEGIHLIGYRRIRELLRY